MLSFNSEKNNCTGCAACYSACPKQCIVMQSDNEGFLYPTADSSICINCGLCEKVCPIVNPKFENTYHQKAISAVSKDYKIWKRSASGGAFSEICRQWADNNTLIVGAAWDGLRVHHIGVIGYENIAPLCKSKYISSPIEDTFIEIKRHLKSKKKVIFCGCPCQVDGLRHFLGKCYENLLTIDLICHGQGSPLVFKESINVLGKQLGEAILSYEFRAKRKIHETDYLVYVKTRKSEYYIINDPYIQLFLSQDALRPSCGKNCRYRDVKRTGDLTIADCKGLTKIYPDLIGTKRNYSTIVSNTAKGESILDKLNQTMEIRPCSLDNVIKYNPLFARQTWFSNNRDTFFSEFQKNPETAIIKETKPYVKYSYTFKKQIIAELPECVVRTTYKIVNIMRYLYQITLVSRKTE